MSGHIGDLTVRAYLQRATSSFMNGTATIDKSMEYNVVLRTFLVHFI